MKIAEFCGCPPKPRGEVLRTPGMVTRDPRVRSTSPLGLLLFLGLRQHADQGAFRLDEIDELRHRGDGDPLVARLVASAHAQVNLDGRTGGDFPRVIAGRLRSEEHTSELQSPMYLVCRLLL